MRLGNLGASGLSVFLLSGIDLGVIAKIFSLPLLVYCLKV